MYLAPNINDELVSCPFDKNHVLLRSRIHYHIVKCRKNHLNIEKIVCPYDATEYLYPEEFATHLFQCKQKTAITRSNYSLKATLEKKAHGDLTPAPFHTPLVQDKTEIWETDDKTCENVESDEASFKFDPVESSMLRNHLMKIYGNTGNADCDTKVEPKKPMGRGALLYSLLGKR